MKLDLYQIDAFAKEVFEGNPAAVVPLDQWLSPQIMQSIAQENNLLSFLTSQKDQLCNMLQASGLVPTR
mgnify:CR=1 FL=1